MAKNEPLTDTRLEAIIQSEITASQTYDSTMLAQKRRQATEYVEGIMTDWPSEKGRSSVVDMSTMDVMSWMLPGIIRVFSSSYRMAIAEPVEPQDEEWAEQATNGINYAFWSDNDGYKLLYDGTYNSLLHGNGIIKHWWDDRPKVRTSFHSGLDDESYQALLTPEDDGKEVEDGEPKEEIEELAHELCEYTVNPGDPGYPMPAGDVAAPLGMAADGPVAPAEAGDATGGLGSPVSGQTPEPAPAPPQPKQVMLHDVKIKRTTRFGKVGLTAIAPEDFIISSDATSLKHARLKGHKEQKTRSDLIEMGFDRDIVETLAMTRDDDDTKLARDDADVDTASDQPVDNSLLEQITLYELYYRIDVDGDGIAETVQIFYAGYGGAGRMLEWNVWEDEEVFSEIPCYPVPHRWNANAVFDRTKDVQEVKTQLVRGALDSMYGSVNPQRFATGRILNPDELANPSFGGTVFGDEGATLTDLPLNFTGDIALKGIEYFDNVIERRTGVSRTTMALDPEALQNQTATASQLAHDAAYSQIELIARNQAELGWKNVFKNVLKLLIRHQERKRTIRLSGKKGPDAWVPIDPRHWNSEMDITINTGLGSGSRDRDLAVMSAMQSDQVALAQILREAQMPGRALEMVPKIINSLEKKSEAAGVRNVDDFFIEVTPEDIQAAAQQVAQKNAQPDPAMAQAQAKMAADAQAAQAKLAMQKQHDDAQMAADVQKHQLQQVTDRMKVQQDMALKREQAGHDAQLQAQKIQADLAAQKYKADVDAQIKREQIAIEAQLKREEMAAEFDLKLKIARMNVAANANTSESGSVGNTQFGGEPG